jgi:hypothetical protein
VVWNDGCIAQFKSGRAWYFVMQFPQLIVCQERPEGIDMCWNYFASGHGKGEVDGASALLKHEIRKEKIKPHACKLQNAKDVVTFCQERVGICPKPTVNYLLHSLLVFFSTQNYHCYHLNGPLVLHC